MTSLGAGFLFDKVERENSFAHPGMRAGMPTYLTPITRRIESA